MRPRPPAAPARAAALAVLVLAPATLGLGACGGGGDAPGEPGEDEAAEAADAVCTLLRGWNDDLGEVVDATSQAVTDDDDPATANGVLLAGYDDLVATAEGHVADVDGLDLPELPGDDRDALLDELRAGAEEAVTVLEEERAAAAELGPIGVAQQSGALGQAFTGVERAASALEPQAAAYDEELQAAFAADEGCRHVVQPTGS